MKVVDVSQETIDIDAWLSDDLKVEISDRLDEIMDELRRFEIMLDLGAWIEIEVVHESYESS